MSKKVWNLVYEFGKTGRVIRAADNPQTRADALAGADVIINNGWHVWVEHSQSKARIFDSATIPGSHKGKFKRGNTAYDHHNENRPSEPCIGSA